MFHCCQKTLFCTYQKWQSDENWCLLAQHLLLLSTSEIIGFVTQLQWVHCVGSFRSWCLFPSGDTVCCDNRYLCHTPWFGCVRGVLHPDLGVQAQQTCSARVAELSSSPAGSGAAAKWLQTTPKCRESPCFSTALRSEESTAFEVCSHWRCVGFDCGCTFPS